MKKSLRVISLVLSIVMIMGCMSVMGYARSEYRGNDAAVLNSLKYSYDDVDSAVYTTEQYATMALDALDRLLNEANLSVYIYIGTLDLKSVTGTVNSVKSVWGAASSLKRLLGDAKDLDLSAIDNTSRETESDLQVIYDVLNLVGDLAPIAQKYVNGSLSLGMLDSVIADYKFNVRELVFGLLCQLTDMGVDEDYDYFESKTIPARYDNTKPENAGVDVTMRFLQDLINNLVLGEWKQLDDLFYTANNKTSWVVYDEYLFHDGSATGAAVTGAMDTATYDYYGWVHPDRWVTFGLGDAIRVPSGAAAPAPSYSKVDLSELGSVYDMVESLLLQAYNGIAVPVLNRITANWLREKCGYTFDEKYTEVYLKDENGNTRYDEDGEPVLNPDYDYLYKGVAPAGGVDPSDKIFKIFDVDNLQVPYATVNNGETFIQALNRNAVNFVDKVIKYTSKSTSGSTTTYTWVDSDNANINYTLALTTGANHPNLLNNIVNVLKFLLKVTEDEFFDVGIINRGEMKTAAEIEDMGYQEVLAYVVRSVINANVDYMYIPDNAETRTLAGAGFEAVLQLAYQDIPQFTYTRPSRASYGNNISGYTFDIVNKALAILMDVAAYNINANLDTEYERKTTGYATTNNGSQNKTGLLSYLGDSHTYGSMISALAAWGVTTWASTTVGNSNTYQCLLNLDLNSDNYGGDYSNLTETMVWQDLDAILDSIIPIKGTDAWIYQGISNSNPVSKTFIFDYLVYPILNGDWQNIYNIFERNTSGVLATDSIEKVLIDTLRNIFNVLFPNVFDASVEKIDDVLDNNLLGTMVYDLLKTLAADGSVTGATNTTETIYARGKIIAGVALPIVCTALGLNSKQEFGELENFIPSIIIPDNNGKYVFQIYNGSSGVNTSYRDQHSDTFERVVDQLFTYEIQTAQCEVISGGSGNKTLSGASNGTKIGDQAVDITLSGLTAGQTLAITFTYKVLGETGTPLKTGNNDTILSSTKYCYVASESTSKGDGEAIAETTIGGKTFKYAPNIYLGSGKGLGSVDGLSLEIKDNTTAGTATITGVSLSGPNTAWLGMETKPSEISATLSGEEGTYVLYPFAADTDHFRRTEYEYAKDADGKDQLDDYGLKIKTAPKTEPGITNIADGCYVATISITAGGANGTIQVYIHLYDDYGLGSLVNNAIKANRSTSTVNNQGSTAFTNYQTALKNAVVFLYAPDNHGYLPGSNPRNNSFEQYITVSGSANKYHQLYKALYTATKNLEPYEISAGAQALWNAVNAIQGYNYTRKSYTANGVTMWYRDYLDYDAPSYDYMGMRRYVAHTYKVVKSAISYANGLIDREFKYTYSEEDFNKLTSAEKAKAAEDFGNIEKDVISSVESAYALHRLEVAESRLIELVGSTSKLNAAITTYSGKSSSNYSAATYNKYAAALQYASDVADGSSNAEQINTAMNELVKAVKGLAKGADFTDLIAKVNEVAAFLNGVGAGINPDDTPDYTTVANQESYTEDSYLALVKAYDNAFTAAQTQELTENEQDKVDSLVAALDEAMNNLVEIVASDFEFILDTTYECEGFAGEIYYPTVDTEFVENFSMEEIYNEDYDYLPISGIIYGLPAYFDIDTASEIFVVSGGDIEIITLDDPDVVGSGSLLIVMDGNGDIQEVYLLAIRGDMNGDADITANDVTTIRNVVYSKPGYDYFDPENENFVVLPAADATGDADVDLADAGLIRNMFYKNTPVDQAYGGEIEE